MKYEDCMDESRESFIDAMIDQAVERERERQKETPATGTEASHIMNAPTKMPVKD